MEGAKHKPNRRRPVGRFQKFNRALPKGGLKTGVGDRSLVSVEVCWARRISEVLSRKGAMPPSVEPF